jgi:hypothetical protein
MPKDNVAYWYFIIMLVEEEDLHTDHSDTVSEMKAKDKVVNSRSVPMN